ncbi:MAG: TIGR03086 family metal-binding protein [Acidimicrobiia bacterium]|nr:TIGR03086 family metal-binding protein [Acidimicrobiia bacterium]
MSENLRTYTRAVYGFDAAVARAANDSWDNPSPCEAWTAADVVAHNIGMNDMIAGFTSGVDARSPVHEIPAHPAAAWRDSLDGLLSALDSQGALQTVARTPWGEMPVDKFLGFAWVDPVVHTWDLAMATGQTPVLDEALVARGTKQLERAGDSLVGEGRFQPAVDLGPGAGPIERFIALTGRDPSAV